MQKVTASAHARYGLLPVAVRPGHAGVGQVGTFKVSRNGRQPARLAPCTLQTAHPLPAQHLQTAHLQPAHPAHHLPRPAAPH